MIEQGVYKHLTRINTDGHIESVDLIAVSSREADGFWKESFTDESTAYTPVKMINHFVLSTEWLNAKLTRDINRQWRNYLEAPVMDRVNSEGLVESVRLVPVAEKE